LQNISIVVSKDALQLLLADFLTALVCKANDFIKRIALNVFFEHFAATINTEAMCAVKLYGDVISNGRVALLNLVGVADGAVVNRYVVLGFLALYLTRCHF